MKVSEVTENDLKMLAKVLNVLHGGEYKLDGKGVCEAADGVRWVQSLAQFCAKVFAEQKASEKPAEVVPKAASAAPSESADIPMSGLSDVKIKNFHPGKASKK